MLYSWFVVHFAHRFYLMLPPDIPLLEMPLPCWCGLSVRSQRAVLLPDLPTPEVWPVRHAGYTACLKACGQDGHKPFICHPWRMEIEFIDYWVNSENEGWIGCFWAVRPSQWHKRSSVVKTNPFLNQASNKKVINFDWEGTKTIQNREPLGTRTIYTARKLGISILWE